MTRQFTQQLDIWVLKSTLWEKELLMFNLI